MWALNCAAYHKKEKQTRELHPCCCTRIVHYFYFNFHLWKYLTLVVVFYIYDAAVSHILRLFFLRNTHTDAEYELGHRKWYLIMGQKLLVRQKLSKRSFGVHYPSASSCFQLFLFTIIYSYFVVIFAPIFWVYLQ